MRLSQRFVATSFVLGGLMAHAQYNPALAAQGWYADPEVHIFAGQYWIYPTDSADAAKTFAPGTFDTLQGQLRAKPHLPKAYLTQTALDAFSSPDLVHWTKHPHVLDVKGVSWAAYAIWAPSVLPQNGKYYLFFGANDLQEQDASPGGIGVAVSSAPGGPFVDLLGKPLIGSYHHGAQPIDPFAFKDDDGTIYLYYGGHAHCDVVRLSADLKQVLPLGDGTTWKEITPAKYVEGPFLIKRHGVYYFMWSEGSWGDASYGVAYAKGPSPVGPFSRAGKILQTDPAVANGPGHHSVLHIPGTDEWYIVYRRHPLGTTDPNERVMAVDRLQFDADGNIEPVKMSVEGVPARPLASSTKR